MGGSLPPTLQSGSPLTAVDEFTLAAICKSKQRDAYADPLVVEAERLPNMCIWGKEDLNPFSDYDAGASYLYLSVGLRKYLCSKVEIQTSTKRIHSQQGMSVTS
jgi:hypothetical protein